MSERPQSKGALASAIEQPKTLFWAVLVAIGVLWGLSGPLSKVALSSGHDPIGITIWNIIIGVVGLGAIVVYRRRGFPAEKRHWIFYAICGFLGTALPHVLSYWGYAVLPVGIMVMMLATVPIITLCISLPLGVEKLTRKRALGLVFGCASIAMLTLPETSLPEAAKAIFILLPLITCLAYATENVYISLRKPVECDVVQILFGLNLTAFFMVVPLVIATDTWFVLWPVAAPEWAIIANSILHLLAYLGFIWLINHAGPVFAAQAAYIVIATGVALGMLFLGERHSIWVWSALACVCIGLAMVQPRDHSSDTASADPEDFGVEKR